MSSIQSSTAECPAWCDDHTHRGNDLIHTGPAYRITFDDCDDIAITARAHRADELPFPGHVEIVPGSTYLTLTFEPDLGESVQLVLDAEQARLFACQIIAMVGVSA